MEIKKTKSYYSVVIIIFVITFFGHLILSAIFQSIKFEAVQQNKRQIKYMVNVSQKALAVFLENVFNELNYLSRTKHVEENSERLQKILDSYYESHKEQNIKNHVYAISRIDSNGVIIASAPYKDVIGLNVGYQPHNKWALKNRKPIVSDVFSTVQGDRAIAVVFPVFLKKKFIGLISILVPYDFIARDFFKGIKFGEGSKTYLVQKDGTILFSEKLDEAGESFYEVPECLKCEPAIEKLLTRKNDFFEFKVKGSSDEIAYAYIETFSLPQNEWKIFIYIPSNVMFKSIKKFSTKLILVAAFMFFSIIIAFVSHNIRDRKLTEKILEREQIFRVVSEKTKQLAFEYNLETDELQWFGKSDEILGYSQEEFSKVNRKQFYGLVHPDDVKMLKDTIAKVLEEKRAHFEVEFRLKHKHGKYIFVYAESGFLSNKKGKPYKMVGSIKDVSYKKIQEEELKRYKSHLEELVQERTRLLQETLKKLQEEIDERKKKEEQLQIAKKKVEAANKLKSEFLAQMSHEIRTPINVLISYTSLLQAELEDKLDPELKEAFHAISLAGDRIIRTVELILNMTDLQTGSFEPHFQKWDVYDQILRRVFFEYLPKAKEKNLALILNEPEGDTHAAVDEFSVRHIFANIIDNAIKYTHKGQVNIRAYRNPDNKLTFEISDTGIGIDEKYIPHLFEAFSQEQQGYTRKFEGNGLGLALVKQYCDINDIDIEIKSEKGKGTTVYLTFKKS